MGQDSLDWVHRFQEGERVQILEQGNCVQRLEVFTQGDDYLHLLVHTEDPLLDRLKYENHFKLRSMTSFSEIDGIITLLDHRDTLASSDPNNGSFRLLKFRPSSLSREGETAPQLLAHGATDFENWGELLHFGSQSATIVPILLGFTYGYWMDWAFSWLAALLALLGGVLLHSASNLHNELSDYHDALLNNRAVETNPVSRLPVNPRTIWVVALILYSLATLMGLPLVLWRRGSFLAVGAIAFLIASYYSLDRYVTPGNFIPRDFLMATLTGPLMAVAASIAATGNWDWELCLASLPVGLFIALYLHEKEMYRLPIDRRAGATTLALLLGFEGSKIYYISLVLMGYIGIAGMVLLNLIPNWTMLSYLSIPLAVRNFRLLRRIDSPLNPNLTELRRSTAALHTTFGFFYITGFLTEVLL